MAKSGKQVLDKVVQFRLSSKELERIETECDKYGIKISEYFRSAVLKKRIRFKTNPQFNQDFSKVRSDFDTLLTYINTAEKIDLHALEELAKISQMLDKVLDDSQA